MHRVTMQASSPQHKTRQDTGKEHEENKFCRPEPKLYHKKSVVLEFNYLDIDKNLPACTLKCVFFLTVKHLQRCVFLLLRGA